MCPLFPDGQYCLNCQGTLRASQSFRLLGHEVLGQHDETLRHQYSSEHLIHGTGRGCPLCIILRDLTFGTSGEPNRTHDVTTYTIRMKITLRSLNGLPKGEVEFIWPEADGHPERSSTFKLSTAPLRLGNEPASIEADLNLGATDSTASASSFEMARRWLNACSATHTGCKPAYKSDILPTRVIRIVSIDSASDSEPFIHICPTEDLKPPVKYLTLSHCWGKNEGGILKLRCDTLADFMDRVPWSEMPLTFRDAIRITHELGYCHLWIDSLCIIQEDDIDGKPALDMAKEVAKMADIYANSSLNIGAKGPDSHAGCFQSRDPLQHKAYVLFQDNINSGRTIYLQPSTTSDFLMSDRLFHRGWVLQERFMATRTLYFGGHGNQIIWECGQGYATEFAPRFRETTGSFYSVLKRDWVQALLSETSDSTSSVDAWYRLLELYSTQGLSKPRDRLPAFSAICQAFAARWDMHCYHGLWLDDLPRGLLWVVSSPEVGRLPQAPSWSWASVRGQISFLFHAHLKLWKVTFTATLRERRPGGRRICIRGSTLHATVDMSHRLHVGGKGRFTFIPDEENIALSGKRLNVECLLLLEGERSPGTHSASNNTMEEGLVLTRAADLDAGEVVYKRIGFFSHNTAKDSNLKGWFRSKLFSKEQAIVRKDVYIE